MVSTSQALNPNSKNNQGIVTSPRVCGLTLNMYHDFELYAGTWIDLQMRKASNLQRFSRT